MCCQTNKPFTTIRRIAIMALAGSMVWMTVPGISLTSGLPGRDTSTDGIGFAWTASGMFPDDTGTVNGTGVPDGVVTPSSHCGGYIVLPPIDPKDPDGTVSGYVNLVAGFTLCLVQDGLELIPPVPCVDDPCPPVPCVTSPCPPPPDPCETGNVCKYIDEFKVNVQNWDPQRDGYPYPTLDCAAGPTIPWVDTDGDGLLDAVDEDDDCDGISDEVENKVGMARLDSDPDRDGIKHGKDLTDTPAPVNILVQAKSLTHPSDGILDDLYNAPDPFLDVDSGFALDDDGDPSGESGYQISIPKLQENDHIHNELEITFSDHTADSDHPEDVAKGLPSDYPGYKQYQNGYPVLQVRLPLWDHDFTSCENLGFSCPSEHPHGNEQEGHDPYPAIDPTWGLLGIAQPGTTTSNVGFSSFQVTSKVLDYGTKATFRLTVGANVAVCDLHIAKLAQGASGTDPVLLSDMSSSQKQDCGV